VKEEDNFCTTGWLRTVILAGVGSNQLGHSFGHSLAMTNRVSAQLFLTGKGWCKSKAEGLALLSNNLEQGSDWGGSLLLDHLPPIRVTFTIAKSLAVLFGLYFLWPLFQSDDSAVTTEPLVLKWEISVIKPKARNAQEAPEVEGKEATTVTVTRSQEIYVNDQPLAHGDLLDELTTRVALAPEKPLFVKSDAVAPYGMIVSIVNKAREAGVERIGLLVDREQPPWKDSEVVGSRPSNSRGKRTR